MKRICLVLFLVSCVAGVGEGQEAARLALGDGTRTVSVNGEAVREIRETVVHEIGHMLGLADDEMPY